MLNQSRILFNDMAWVLLWIIICSTPIVFWSGLWLLLPPTVWVAVLSVGPVAGCLVTCWSTLSRASRPRRTQPPTIVPPRLPMATPVPLMAEWSRTVSTYVPLS